MSKQPPSLPEWLEKTKSSLMESKPWNDLLDEVYASVKKQLKSNCVEVRENLGGNQI